MSAKKGGPRAGAGRPKGSGKYQEGTSPIRVPGSLLSQVQNLLNQRETIDQCSAQTSVPFYTSRIAAGGPTTADDHVDAYVDFNDYLRPDSETMFCIRALDDAMTGAGIYPNDVLIVDRALKATDQKIVVVDWNGRPMIRRLHVQARKTELMPENVAYEPILITENIDFKILGVAIRVIHALP